MQARRRAGRCGRREAVALVALILAVGALHGAWIRVDTLPMPHWDPYGYMQSTLDFVERLDAEGPRAWTSLATLSLAGRPPLYQILTLPLVRWLGTSEDVFLSINVLFGALLLVCVFGLGVECRDARAGLLAALLAACLPPLVQLTWIYRPHAALPACAAASLYLLLRLLRTRSVALAWLFSASLAFGLWLHPSFAWTLAVPSVLGGLQLWLCGGEAQLPRSLRALPGWAAARLRDPLLLRGLLPGALAAAALVGAWYLAAGGQLLAVFQLYWGRAGEASAPVGLVRDGFFEIDSAFWWYARSAPGALSWPIALLIPLGLVGGVFARSPAIRLLVVAFVAGYALVNQQPARAWWYFAPLLPVAAVLVAVWITGLRRWLALPFGAVCVAAALFGLAVVTLGVGPRTEPIARLLGAPLDTDTCEMRRATAFCPNPPRHEHWPFRELLEPMLSDARCQARSCRVLLVPDRNVLTEFALLHELRRSFPAGRSQLEVETVENQFWLPWLRFYPLAALLESDFQLFTDEPPRSLANYPGKTWSLLMEPPELFARAHRELAVLPLPNGRSAQLLTRARELSGAEVEESLRWLTAEQGLDPENAFLADALRARLHGRAGEVEPAQRLYRKALAVAPLPSLRAQYQAELGDVHAAAGRTELALGAYRAALEELQRAPGVEAPAASRLRRASEALERGDLEAARAELEKLWPSPLLEPAALVRDGLRRLQRPAG